MPVASQAPTVLIVPGLRDHVARHWQTLLIEQLPRVHAVAPMGRANLDREARVAAIERAALRIVGPIVIVAHSGGCITVAHWAARTQCRVHGALLATPADFERPMPEGYPTVVELDDAGWLPVPRAPLPFRSIVAASRNDPLASYDRVAELAAAWGSECVDLGPVGPLNPASGFGEWPGAAALIDALSQSAGPAAA